MKTTQVLVLLIFFFLFSSHIYSQAIIADHTKAKLEPIPSSAIELAKANLHIAYDHTSHGSQIITGMNDLIGQTNLVGYKGDIYEWNEGGTDGALDIDDYFSPVDDLGYETQWAPATRTYLDDPANADVNVVMWSWCNIYGHNIDDYLANMETLISEYGPGGTKITDGTRTVPVTFVFMTGHTNAGSTENEWTFNANKKIRQHCIDNNRVLFDFFDIECYNPDGEYFGDGEPNLENYGTYNGLKDLEDDCSYDLDGGGRGNWAVEWQNSHTQNVDWYSCSSAHSQPLNANLKAYAAWWLWARLAGWNPDSEPSVAISSGTSLSETNLDEASISLELTDETFADNTLSSSNFQLNNAPDGTTIESIEYTNDHQATINLAFDGTDFDNDITNFNITVLATELSGDENLTSNNLTIDAVNEEGPIATLSSDSELRENSLDGAVVKVTLTNEVFASDCAVCDNFELCNIPVGVGLLEVERNSDTEVEITLSFDGTDFDEDSINFCVRVKANAIGGSVDLLSSKVTIYADMESNIVNIDNNQNLKIYPNPVNDYVTLEFKSASERKISLQLIDLTGKKIMEKEFGGGALYLEKTLNLSDLKKGNYYLVVHQGEKRTITSVVKQ